MASINHFGGTTVSNNNKIQDVSVQMAVEGSREKETDYCTCEGRGADIQNTIKVTRDSRSSGSGKRDTEPGGKIFKD